MTDLDQLLTLARAKGSDKAFRLWVSYQPSVLDGGYDWVDGVGRCEAEHVRRGGKSGTAYKEPYACVPLTWKQHRYQHQHGERACIERFTGFDVSEEEGKAWFDQKRMEILERWVKS